MRSGEEQDRKMQTCLITYQNIGDNCEWYSIFKSEHVPSSAMKNVEYEWGTLSCHEVFTHALQKNLI